MSGALEGFILHSYARSRENRTFLYLLGRLEDGSTFAVVETRYQPNFYVREFDGGRIRQVMEALAGSPGRDGGDLFRLAGTALRTMDGAPCLQVLCSTQGAKVELRDALSSVGIRTYEADLRVADQFRLERRIHGPVRIRGEARTGHYVQRVFVDPELEPGQWLPRLSVLSIDIETDVRTSAVRAIALSHQDPYAGQPDQLREMVLFHGPDLGEPAIRCYSEEKSLLEAFRDQLSELDPDIITGWNVVDFDFPVLAGRFERFGLPLRLGRSREAAVYLPPSKGRGSRVIVPGRQVWDGVRIVRASPDTYEDYSLETVAEALLGYGKLIELGEGESRLQAIDRLYRVQPAELCAYCLQDARLVHEIFARTGLFELTLRRCVLIGVAPDLAWTSIPAFEYLYTEALHGRGLVAPTFGVDPLPMEGVPGGIILAPRPGVFDEVLVFDFQSLYPSIIRTFNIDPVSHVPRDRPAHMEEQRKSELIRAPNGACFSREPGILPELLDRFFEQRREAQEKGDAVASFVFKIIMNSFYGVLGARGCRFAGSDLAGSITSFGQRIVSWCRELLEQRGYSVLYGDTDSLFVTVAGGAAARERATPPAAAAAGRKAATPAEAAAAGGKTAPASAAAHAGPSSAAPLLDGQEICRLVNTALAEHLSEKYRVRPRLNLKFEKKYERFFLPPLRGPDNRSEKGRAKGYAGLLASEPGQDRGAEELRPVAERIEVRGMEAVRRDWTDLAHRFQIRLLELVFLRQPLQEFKSYIDETVRSLYRGELDQALVYRKALRKPISAYTRSTPPHVKAASLLPASQQRGLIRYLVTVAGPQPLGQISAAIDYDHYLERQLKPIASAFTEVLKSDLEALFGRGGQLWLF